MAYENLNFQKPHMTYYNNYFYMFDDDNDILIQKLQDGDTAFSYPLSTQLAAITSLENDTEFLWTMENYDNCVYIKQWYIDNCICKLHNTFPLILMSSADSFTLEYYTSTLTSGTISGALSFEINDNFEDVVTSGTLMYICLDDGFEENTVTAVSGTTVFLNTKLTNNYVAGTKILFDVNFILFSNGALNIIPITVSSGNNFLLFGGNYSNQQGNWEYTIASNVYLESGLYKVTFDAYDVDQKDEMGLRIRNGVDTLDVKANSTGNNVWKFQSGKLCINDSGIYDIVGIQFRSSSNNWGIANVRLYRDILHEVVKVGYWPGDHSNKQGSWEYTIASNIYLEEGQYFVKFDAYDADTSDEMSLRFESGSTTLDILAGRTGSDQWVEQDNIFNITVSGGYDIKGRQLKNYSYIWGIDKVYLYKLNEIDYDKHSDSEYVDIFACTFGNIKGIKSSPRYYLSYIKGANLKFLNLKTFNLEAVATLDNIKTDNTIIKIYDLAIDEYNIFRLQKEANYYEHDYSWSTYNYVLSTSRRFIDTINVSAYPVILPANAINTAKISAIVNDQYGDGVINKPVHFIDDDAVGFITIPTVYTDYFFGTGEAVTYYKAGVTPRTVTIEGTATQYD